MEISSGKAEQFFQLAKLPFTVGESVSGLTQHHSYHIPCSCIAKGKRNPLQTFLDVSQCPSSSLLLQGEGPTQPLLHKDAPGISLKPRDRE